MAIGIVIPLKEQACVLLSFYVQIRMTLFRSGKKWSRIWVTICDGHFYIYCMVSYKYPVCKAYMGDKTDTDMYVYWIFVNPPLWFRAILWPINDMVDCKFSAYYNIIHYFHDIVHSWHNTIMDKSTPRVKFNGQS